MDKYNKRILNFIFKLLLIAGIIAIIVSIPYLLLSASRRKAGSDNDQSSASNRTAVDINSQSKVIKKIEEYDIQQSLGVTFDVAITKRATVDDWLIIVIEPKNQETDPGLLIYKKTGDGDSAKLIIGPGTFFSRQQMLHREIPERVINNSIIQPFVGE